MRSRLRELARRLSPGLFGHRTDEERSETTGRENIRSEDAEADPGDAEADLGDAEAEEAVPPESHLNPEEVSVEYDPEEVEKRADVLAEVGMDPGEFVTGLLEDQGGRMKQQAFTEYTNWSEATVSRQLQALEDDGDIVRVQLGREHLVCLPDETPAWASIEPQESDDSPA